jgi:hypothetical protein
MRTSNLRLTEQLIFAEITHENRPPTPWILKGFRSPRRTLPGIEDYFNRKGLVSDQGEKKKAFFVLQKFYQELQSAQVP